MDLTTFHNYFPEDAFYTDESDGLKRINDPTDVFVALRELCPNGYSWTHKASGFTPDGRVYVVTELQVMLENGVHTTIGSATGATSANDIAGVITLSLMNACLRGLGMGEHVYVGRSEEHHEVVPAPPPPPPPVQPAPNARPQYQQRPAPNGGGYGARNNGGSSGYGGQRNNSAPVWDGSALLKSGKYVGQPYSSVSLADLQFWAGGENPNRQAIKELQRRMTLNGSPAVETVFT